MTGAAASPPHKPSPCIRRCALDAAGKTCTGCLRTVDEITRWSVMSPAEQDRVIARLAARRSEDASVHRPDDPR